MALKLKNTIKSATKKQICYVAPPDPPDYKKIPRWLEHPLQGLAFWIGYQRAIFKYSIMKEAAAESELIRLVYAHLDDDDVVRPEETFKRLGFAGDGQKRIDFVVGSKCRGFEKHNHSVLRAVVEIKRAYDDNGGTQLIQIKNDLKKLSIIKDKFNNTRCFVVVVSEAKIPLDFVNISYASEDSNQVSSVAPKRNTSDMLQHHAYKPKVLTIKKAAGVVSRNYIKSRENHYVVLLEVVATGAPK